jgi:hypothetical protein
MLKIRAVNVWPSAFDYAILSVRGVLDYRGIVRYDQNGTEEILVTLEVGSESDDSVTAEVVTSVRIACGLTVDTEVVSEGTLRSRVPEGYVKLSRWHDERPEQRRE